MTKEQFDAARRWAVTAYVQAAQRDFEPSRAETRERANAQRRLLCCEELLALWEQNGFWTVDNLRAYEMIYRHYEDGCAVSAF